MHTSLYSRHNLQDKIYFWTSLVGINRTVSCCQHYECLQTRPHRYVCIVQPWHLGFCKEPFPSYCFLCVVFWWWCPCKMKWYLPADVMTSRKTPMTMCGLLWHSGLSAYGLILQIYSNNHLRITSKHLGMAHFTKDKHNSIILQQMLRQLAKISHCSIWTPLTLMMENKYYKPNGNYLLSLASTCC